MLPWLLLLPLLLVLMALLYPALLCIMYVSYWLAWRKSLDARVESWGLLVYSRTKGAYGKYQWQELERLSCGFRPPISYAIIVLKTGEKIHLESAAFRPLSDEFKLRGLSVETG